MIFSLFRRSTIFFASSKALRPRRQTINDEHLAAASGLSPPFSLLRRRLERRARLRGSPDVRRESARFAAAAFLRGQRGIRVRKPRRGLGTRAAGLRVSFDLFRPRLRRGPDPGPGAPLRQGPRASLSRADRCFSSAIATAAGSPCRWRSISCGAAAICPACSGRMGRSSRHPILATFCSSTDATAHTIPNSPHSIPSPPGDGCSGASPALRSMGNMMSFWTTPERSPAN